MGVFEAICAIIAIICKSLLLKIMVGALVSACIVWWDEFGADFLSFLGAVICIVGIIYIGLACAFTSLGWSVALEDVMVVVVAGLIGIKDLAKWLKAALMYIVGFILSVLKAVDNAFPWIKYAIGAACVYLLMSSNSSSSYQPVYVQEPSSGPNEIPHQEI